MDRRHLPFSEERKRLISKRTRLAMARPEVKAKLVGLKGNGNGFKKGKLNPMYGKKGNQALNWKGNAACYTAKHQRIVKLFGKPKRCNVCGNIKKIQWANINHKYSLKKEDWKQLCPKCHAKYDRRYNNKNYRELKLNKYILSSLYKLGYSYRKIAREMNVSSHHIIKKYLIKYHII